MGAHGHTRTWAHNLRIPSKFEIFDHVCGSWSLDSGNSRDKSAQLNHQRFLGIFNSCCFTSKVSLLISIWQLLLLLLKRPVGLTSSHWKAKVWPFEQIIYEKLPLEPQTGPEPTTQVQVGRASHRGKILLIGHEKSELSASVGVWDWVLMAVGPWGDCCMRQSSD